jgi:hypothetical protein
LVSFLLLKTDILKWLSHNFLLEILSWSSIESVIKDWVEVRGEFLNILQTAIHQTSTNSLSKAAWDKKELQNQKSSQVSAYPELLRISEQHDPA